VDKRPDTESYRESLQSSDTRDRYNRYSEQFSHSYSSRNGNERRESSSSAHAHHQQHYQESSSRDSDRISSSSFRDNRERNSTGGQERERFSFGSHSHHVDVEKSTLNGTNSLIRQSFDASSTVESVSEPRPEADQVPTLDNVPPLPDKAAGSDPRDERDDDVLPLPQEPETLFKSSLKKPFSHHHPEPQALPEPEDRRQSSSYNSRQ
jgi:hypothetical protein